MSSKIIVGRYELLEKIGDGGMAIVYKAKDRMLNRLVAVKILKPEYARDAKFVESFKKESHAAASLSNPNIVSIFDVGREGNINYIVMELVEGKTLNDVIAESAPLDYKQAIAITRQIASGLAAAHKHGIIHRDVKPHNVLINEDGVAKIADFGIAKAVTGATIVEGTSEAVMGSVHYFSPEQARGIYVDERSDIYSLGIVLYEMLTGEVPFDGDNPVNVALRHINEDVPAPSQKIPNIPPALDKIVLKATARVQTSRYRSAEELIDDLDNIELVSRVVGGAAFTTGTARRRDERKEYERQRQYPADDYDDRGNNNLPKKKSKKKLVITIIILLALAGGGVAAAFGFGLIGPKNIEVPDVVGLTYNEAKTEIEDAGLRIAEGDPVKSNKVRNGEIAEQDPAGGEMARARQVVTVCLNAGGSGTVPNLIGMPEDEAKELIESCGFKVGSVETKAGTKPEGEVTHQDPKAGEEAEAGTKINLVLSDGKGAKVPNLVGLTKDQAKSAIESAGFKVGSITKGNSSTYSKGTVISQQYESGTTLEKGKSISFVVSNGAGSGSVSLYIDYSEAENEVFYMTVTVSDSNGTRNVVSSKQRHKSDGGETLKIKGTGKGTITVIFDSKTVMKQHANFGTGELS